ncbi:type 1 fimbrial protein [Salmonella enterica subsp. enterica serovar Sandiego]|nr:type 1 fimbrial protein [Salmonella enterica subsp. enterica serovar Sandiego]
MKLLAIAVLSAAGMSAASAATQGTLTITGNVVDQTCEVAAAQLTRTVDLGDITQGIIKAAAQNASVANQPLVFAVTGCPASATGVGIKFDYTADATNTQYLANTGNGKGVLLGITDDADALVAPQAWGLNSTIRQTQPTPSIWRIPGMVRVYCWVLRMMQMLWWHRAVR